MRIAHLSDLHFGRHTSNEKLEALKKDLTRTPLELLVITGDITDRGLKSQYDQAMNFLESQDIPCVVAPGNREVSFTAFWEWIVPKLSLARFERYFGPKDRIVHVFPDHKIVLFGLNSVHWFPSWPGKLARKTRYWFKQEAAGYDGFFKAVFLHHPVLPVIRSSSYWAHGFSDAAALLDVCTETGISLILQGHKHRASVMEVRFPQRNANVVVSAGGAPLMPWWDSSYNVINLADSFLFVETREFRDGQFIVVEKYQFEL